VGTKHKTHCVNGHEMTPDNRYIHYKKRNGKVYECWACRICKTDANRRRRQMRWYTIPRKQRRTSDGN
jgi:hypothetical protein